MCHHVGIWVTEASQSLVTHSLGVQRPLAACGPPRGLPCSGFVDGSLPPEILLNLVHQQSWPLSAASPGALPAVPSRAAKGAPRGGSAASLQVAPRPRCVRLLGTLGGLAGACAGLCVARHWDLVLDSPPGLDPQTHGSHECKALVGVRAVLLTGPRKMGRRP